MEKKYQFVSSNHHRQFVDLTNYNSPPSFRDTPKPSLRVSQINQKNNQTSNSRSKSKNNTIIKGISKHEDYGKKKDTSFSNKFYQPSFQNNVSNSISDFKNFYKRQSYLTKTGDYSAFLKQPLNASNCTRSLKVSRQFGSKEIQQIKNIAQRQSRFNTNTKNSFQDKQKFNFRQSLGSLSKQIKNTLKSTIITDSNNNTFENISNSRVEKKKSSYQNSQPYSSIKSAVPGTDGEGQLYTRYQKTSSFMLSNPSSFKAKRPKHLELKFQKLQISKKQQKQNLQNFQYNTSRNSSRTKTQIHNNLLRQSAVIPISPKHQGLQKNISFLQPSTPQLRKDKKYQTYNYERQRKGYSNYQASSYKKPLDLTSSVSLIKKNTQYQSQFSSKSSFLQYSTVIPSTLYSSSVSARQRDSLSSKGRDSMDKQISLSDFHLGSVKGEGRFGKFYPAIHKKSGLLVGIKQIKKDSLKHMLEQFIQQLKVQSFINHPNIVKLYGYFATKQNFYLILQYMQEGSLFTYIKKSKKVSEQQASTKLKQICSAVQYLHENQILHRDIKPENIVLTCDVCKLCDFGWAVYSSARRKTYCGTLDYVCPQILQGDSYDSCVDIWAIGVLAYEMIVGKAPFYNISRKQTMKKIMECNFQLPKQLSQQVKQFISKALNKNANERSSINELNKHKFLN